MFRQSWVETSLCRLLVREVSLPLLGLGFLICKVKILKPIFARLLRRLRREWGSKKCSAFSEGLRTHGHEGGGDVLSPTSRRREQGGKPSRRGATRLFGGPGRLAPTWGCLLPAPSALLPWQLRLRGEHGRHGNHRGDTLSCGGAGEPAGCVHSRPQPGSAPKEEGVITLSIGVLEPTGVALRASTA